MQNKFKFEFRRFRQRWIVALLLATSVTLVGLALVSSLNKTLVVTPDVGEIPPVQISLKSSSELLSLESYRLDGCDIALMNLLCAEGLPNTEGLDVQGSLALLDGWAIRVKSETQRHFYRFQRNSGEFEHSEGYFRMLMMAVVLHEDFHVRYNPRRIAMLGQVAMGDGFFADSRDVFLHGLLSPRRMGTCSSMPVLYVALGRRLGYPLKLVTTKGHLFVRWESSVERFNVDATGQGMNRYDDEHYRNWPFPLSDAEIMEHGYLKSLSPAEELAVFLSIRGQCLMESGLDAEAVASLEHAVRLRPAVRDQALLLAQAQAKRDGVMEPQPSVSRAAPAEFGQIPSPPNAIHSSDPVPDPNPLRQIR